MSATSFAARIPYALRVLLGGDPARAIEVSPPIEIAGDVPSFVAVARGARAHVYAAAERERGAPAELQGWREAVEAMGLFGQPAPLFIAFAVAMGTISGPLVAILEAGEATWIYSVLTSDPWATVQSQSALSVRGIDTPRGELASRLSELGDAERWFRHGIEFGEKWELALVVGRCHQGLVDVAERRGDHAAGDGAPQRRGRAVLAARRCEVVPGLGAGEEADARGVTRGRRTTTPQPHSSRSTAARSVWRLLASPAFGYLDQVLAKKQMLRA